MKKHVIIGDIHGSNLWEKIVENHSGEDVRYVFVGDYFDSFYIDTETQMANLGKLIEFYKNNDCVLLMGNHDLHYLYPFKECKCSGYNIHTQMKVSEFCEKNNVKLFDELKFCYWVTDKIVCSHAGFTDTWLRNNDLTLKIDEPIEEYCKGRLSSVMYNQDDPSGFGDSACQGPLWVRPFYMEYDTMGTREITQIVGHTHFNGVSQNNSKNVYFIDNFPSTQNSQRDKVYYLVISEDGEIEPEYIFNPNVPEIE